MAKTKTTSVSRDTRLLTLNTILETMFFDEVLTLRNRIKNRLDMDRRLDCLALLDARLSALSTPQTNPQPVSGGTTR